MLACFGYFLVYLQPYLIRARKIDVTENDLATDSIEVIFAKNVFIWGIFGQFVFLESISARGTYVDIELSSINS